MASEIASCKRKRLAPKKERPYKAQLTSMRSISPPFHDIVKNKKRVMNQRQKHIHDYFAKL